MKALQANVKEILCAVPSWMAVQGLCFLAGQSPFGSVKQVCGGLYEIHFLEEVQ